ncbi:hypothetical protein A2U01_0088068, partial [Trifolium medium]|nr:hypothetical protein [Trifolium medium]
VIGPPKLWIASLMSWIVSSSPLEPEAELPVQVVAGVELFVVAGCASFPYDSFQPAPTIPDIACASLVVAVTFGSTNLLQGKFP